MALPTVYDADIVKQYIDQLILGNKAILDSHLEQVVGQIRSGAEQIVSIKSILEQADAKLKEGDQRVSDIVARANECDAKSNALFAQVQGEFAVQRTKIAEADERNENSNIYFKQVQEEFAVQRTKIEEARVKAEEMEANMKSMVDGVKTFAESSEKKFAMTQTSVSDSAAKLKLEVATWASDFQEKMAHALKMGDIGTLAGAREKKGPKMDRKEVAVWKIPDGVSKPDFRHWLDAVDVQLESSHDFQLPDVVLDKVRRLKTEVKETDLMEVLMAINIENEEKRIAEEKEHRVYKYERLEESRWEFMEKTRFMHSYLVSKLNTELHGKTINIENKNGFEMYRQICNIVDALPENYKFYLDTQLMLLTQHSDKIKGLKELYGFRLLLTSKVAAYKKAVGEEPSQDRLKEILWCVMDVASKDLANLRGLDKMGYK